jgi:hypothetical protein
MSEAIEIAADQSVDWRQFIGDGCAYLAAQCRARIMRGLVPTDDQAEAWLCENTYNAVNYQVVL